MSLDIKKDVNNPLEMQDGILVRRMVINKEEPVRVKLQNNIFGNAQGRRELTLLEVYSEERKSSFLKEMCFILDVHGEPGGYGQILISDDEYYLVNFGVINEYRSKGYGLYFLSKIIENCSLSGINHLNLCVDNDNTPAINLYKKLGFKELYSKFNMRFR
jgi:ribosomal protein S18 acetylase RimI-like enzyme